MSDLKVTQGDRTKLPFPIWSGPPDGYPLRINDGEIVAIPPVPSDLHGIFRKILGHGAWEPRAHTGVQAEIYTGTHYRVGAFADALKAQEEIDGLVGQTRFGIGAHGSVNAAAFQSPGPTICINHGTLMTLRAVIFGALANPQCYPGFESSVESRERARVKDFDDPSGGFRTPGFIDGPLSPMRRSMAELLFGDAVLFCWAHEFAHLYRGHLGLLHGLGSGPLTEARSLATARDGPDRHAMELDADRLAVMMTMLGHVKGPGDRDAAFRIRMWFTAVTMLFFVFDNQQLPWDDQSTTHPHPLVRWMLLASAAVEALGWERREEFEQIRSTSADDLRVICQVVGLTQFDLLGPVLEQQERLYDLSFLAWKRLTEFREGLGDFTASEDRG